MLVLKQTARAFVKKLDFVTSVGHLDGGEARERLRLPGKGPVAVVTDLCLMEPDPVTKELTVTQIHPGVTREQIVKAPTNTELGTLRDLERRSKLAHGNLTVV